METLDSTFEDAENGIAPSMHAENNNSNIALYENGKIIIDTPLCILPPHGHT